jgi:hypothetical protein
MPMQNNYGGSQLPQASEITDLNKAFEVLNNPMLQRALQVLAMSQQVPGYSGQPQNSNNMPNNMPNGQFNSQFQTNYAPRYVLNNM